MNKMKKHILYSMGFLFAASVLTGCSENAWNDHLDGFEGGFSYTDKTTVSYTLSNSDYETIGKALAKVATNDAETNAAKAIQSNHYFDQSSPYPAQVAIPYLFDDTSSSYFIYNNGSVVETTFRQAQSTPEELSQISSAHTYTLTSANYKSVWGSDTDYINSFSPSTQPASYIPNILKAQYADAKEGDYAIVTYDMASENPVFGNMGGEESVEITDAIKNLAVGDNLKAVAVVTAHCTRGLILTDNGGSILYYNTAVDLSAFPVGSIVKVSGEISAYNKGLQLANTASLEVVGEETYEYPAPVMYNASMIDEAVTGTENELAKYISLQGELSISGNYLNILIDGTSVQGSVYYATDEVLAKLENGKSYVFTGYFTSFTAKYLYIVVTDVTPLADVTLTDAIKDLSVGDKLTATAVVTAQCSRGLILTDNAGSILYYNTAVDLAAYPVGTAVNVSGEVSAYNHGLQLSNTASLEVLGMAAYTYPEPTVYTNAMIEEALGEEGNLTASYVQIQGQLSISGNYFNVILDGSEAQGSIYYPTDALKAELENGASYVYTGYFTSVASGKYFYMVVTEVKPLVATSSYAYANTRATAFAPVSVTENAVYYFDGSKWAPAEDVAVLNPSDYDAMGFANNSLTDADVYIPLYLKSNYPYALAGDEVYVAYNLKTNVASCDLFVYDGSAWTLNNNALETVTASFTKSDGAWKFTKYLGKAIFTLYDEAQISLDRTYMFVSGDYCANPVLATNSYGYLLTTAVTISGNSITMPNENNGFQFLSSVELEDGSSVKVPDGYFVIKDSNERYLYLQGTYSSFNVTDNPANVVSGGSVGEGYLFSATKLDSGAWMITNNRGEGNIRNLYFSSKYTNFAAYTDQSADDSFPFIYILEEE